VGIVRLETKTGKFIDINDAFCRIVGYSESELKELRFHQITHEEDIENDLKTLNSLKRGSKIFGSNKTLHTQNR